MHQANKSKARAIFYKDGKVLMIWRYRDGNEYYVFPGGTIEDGETIEETLIREAYEETNLEFTKYKEFFKFTNTVEDKGINYSREERFYFITEFTGEIKLGNPELGSQTRENIYRHEWIDVSNLDRIDYNPRTIFDDIKKEIKLYEQS